MERAWIKPVCVCNVGVLEGNKSMRPEKMERGNSRYVFEDS